MSLLRYSEPDLRRLLGKAISVRWPNEQILVLTGCNKVDGDPAQSSASHFEVARFPTSASAEANGGAEPGFLAVTQSRLIFQEEFSTGLVLRSTSLVIGALSVAALFFGDGLPSFIAIATMAAVLWGVAKVVEMLLVARADIEFDRVGSMDPSSQRIEGTGRNGVRYRLGIRDPSDFLLVAALVQGRAAAA